jgi:hypothetical protein
MYSSKFREWQESWRAGVQKCWREFPYVREKARSGVWFRSPGALNSFHTTIKQFKDLSGKQHARRTSLSGLPLPVLPHTPSLAGVSGPLAHVTRVCVQALLFERFPDLQIHARPAVSVVALFRVAKISCMLNVRSRNSGQHSLF